MLNLGLMARPILEKLGWRVQCKYIGCSMLAQAKVTQPPSKPMMRFPGTLTAQCGRAGVGTSAAALVPTQWCPTPCQTKTQYGKRSWGFKVYINNTHMQLLNHSYCPHAYTGAVPLVPHGSF